MISGRYMNTRNMVITVVTSAVISINLIIGTVQRCLRS